jgi:hypothetical protein
MKPKNVGVVALWSANPDNGSSITNNGGEFSSYNWAQTDSGAQPDRVQCVQAAYSREIKRSVHEANYSPHLVPKVIFLCICHL